MRVQLAAFIFLTSVGYIIYSLFLGRAAVSSLLLSTYSGVLIYYTLFDKKRIYGVAASFKLTSATHWDISYALCIFAYWYLFWTGLKVLGDSGAATELAVSFLALNMVALPVAIHFAKGSFRNRNFALQAFVGLFLILAVVLVETNSPLDLSNLNGSSLHSFSSGIVSDFKNIDYSFFIAVLCFSCAIFFEGAGDYFNKKKDIWADSECGNKYLEKEIDKLYAWKAHYVSKNRNVSLIDLVESVKSDLSAKLAVAKENIEVCDEYYSKYSASLPVDSAERLGAQEASSRAYADYNRLAQDVSDLEKIEIEAPGLLASSAGLKWQKKKKQEIVDRFWSPVFEYIKSSDVEVEHPKRNSAIVKQTELEAEDLTRNHVHSVSAVVGFFLALVLCLGDLDLVQHLNAAEKAAYALLLAVLGMTGASARAVLLAPAIGKKGSNVEALIPPAYAFRLLPFFFLMFLVEHSGFRDFLSSVDFFDVSPVDEGKQRNAGWFLGIGIAVLISSWAWYHATLPTEKED